MSPVLLCPKIPSQELRILGDFEDGEVDRAVGAVVSEVRECREIKLLRVLDDKDAARMKQARLKHHSGDVAEAVEVIRRVGKHKIKGRLGVADEAQGIGAEQVEIPVAKLLLHLLDKARLSSRLLDRGHRGGATRKQLEANGTRTGKKVQTAQALNVDHIFNHIEYILAGEIGCRAGSDICRDVEASTSVFSSDYSHKGVIIKSNGASMASFPALNISGGKIIGITRLINVRSLGVSISRVC